MSTRKAAFGRMRSLPRRRGASLADLGGHPSERGRARFRSRSWRRRRNRRALKLVLLAAAVLGLGILAAAADAYYQSFQVYRDVRTVLPNLRQASDSLAKGRLPAGDPFGKADAAVRRAGRQIDGARFTFRLTGALPFLGRPVDAVRHGVAAAGRVTQAGLITQDAVSDLLGEAARSEEAVRAADTPLYEGGVVNVELLEAMVPRLDTVMSHLRTARREIGAIPALPLVPQVSEEKQQAIADTDRALRLADRIRTGIRVLAPFLGAEGTRTYLIALQNQTDLRGTGGAPLAYGLVEVDKGRFELVAGGSVLDLRLDPSSLPPGTPRLRIDVPLPPSVSWYIDQLPGSYPWLATANFSPDFPNVGATWARMAERATGVQIDGVIAMDQVAVARALGTRKIRVPGYPRPISGGNLVKVVSHDQYYLPGLQQRAFPAALIASAWPKLIDPESLQDSLRMFGESFQQKRIQLWLARPDLQGALRELGWDGGMRVAPGDYLYLVDNKTIVNKVDYYAHVAIDYDVTIDRAGNADAALTVTLANDSPAGLPMTIARRNQGGYALNRALMLAIVPSEAELVSAAPRAGLPDHLEGGAKVFARTIRAAAGEEATLELRYRTPGVVNTVAGRKVYRLTLQHQPKLQPTEVTITVTLPNGAIVSTAPPGWTIKDNVLTLETQLTRDVVYEIAF